VRYEGDYQTAEARSRDKLREAKHGYSLKYDFGYDEAEDAARHAFELDRFDPANRALLAQFGVVP